MKQLLSVLLATLLLFIFGCNARGGVEDCALEEISYTSDVSAQGCFLWGKNMVATNDTATILC